MSVVENSTVNSEDAAELRQIFFIAIVLTILISLITLIAICVIFVLLICKVRVRCHNVWRQVKIAQKLVKDQLSPPVDDFLAILSEISMKEEKAKQIYTDYDSHRREVVEKELKFELTNLRKLKIFDTVFSETSFIKGGGFRMHRLLHEGRFETFENEDEGMTILAKPFSLIKGPIKKELPPTEGTKSPITGTKSPKVAAKAKKSN